MLVLPIDPLQSIHHVVSQSLAAVDHNWVLNRVASPLGTFHIIILCRKRRLLWLFSPLFEFGNIPSDLVLAPKNHFYITGKLYFICSLYPFFPVEYSTGQQSQFNCTVGLLNESRISSRTSEQCKLHFGLCISEGINLSMVRGAGLFEIKINFFQDCTAASNRVLG